MQEKIKPITVAALLPPPAWGGLHAHVEITSKAFKALGFGEIKPIIPSDEVANPIAERYEKEGISVLRTPMSRIRFSPKPSHHIKYAKHIRSEVKALHKLADEANIDVIQTAGAHHFHGLFSAKASKKPLVWQLHSDLAPSLARRGVSPIIKSTANAIMVNGKRIAKKFHGIDRTNRPFHVFYPIVDVEKFTITQTDRIAAKKRLGLEEKVVIGTVGVRSRQKNHQLLIQAAYKLSKIRDDFTILIVGKDVAGGEDDYIRDVVSLPETQSLTEKGLVQFIQPELDIVDYLAAFDIFALSSISEGMPIAVAEAMCAGLPIVSTDVGSMNEMVVSGFSGALVNPNDSHELSQALLPLIENGEMRQLFGHASREKCLMEFSPENSAQIHHKAYMEALEHFQS